MLEYTSTLNYIGAGAAGLGWTATVGDGIVCMHMGVNEWGWNARGASDDYIGVELAQGQLGETITDIQIEGLAAVWAKAREHYGPDFPLRFVNHSDLPEGVADGKTDVEPKGQHSVIDRVLARLRAAGYR